MSILIPLDWSSRATEPFCDYLNVTVPVDHREQFDSDIRGYFHSLGLSEDEFLPGVYRIGEYGTFKVGKRGKVLVASASGDALSHLRLIGGLSDYLTVLAAFPHRVSMLHATCDFVVPSPPAVIQEVKRMAYAEGLRLTRKTIRKEQVKCFMSIDQDGLETGTIYLGQRANADVWAKVYDKAHEGLRRGDTRHAHLVRLEIAIHSDMGATLRDAIEPANAFLQFASKSLLTPPQSFSGWEGKGEGYVLPQDVPKGITVYQQIEQIIEQCPDLLRLRRLARREFGDRACEVIARLLVGSDTMTASLPSGG